MKKKPSLFLLLLSLLFLSLYIFRDFLISSFVTSKSKKPITNESKEIKLNLSSALENNFGPKKNLNLPSSSDDLNSYNDIEKDQEIETKKIEDDLKFDSISNNDLENEISRIDIKIDDNDFIKKANEQTLTPQEKNELFVLMKRRDQFFKEKIQRTLSKFGYQL